MLRKRVFLGALIVMSVGLIISLIMNNIYSKRINREHQYKHLLYNKLMFDVYSAANQFRDSNHLDFKRAAVNMADAASVLSDLGSQEQIVENRNMTNRSRINETANFMSYVSLALVGENDSYLTGSSSQNVITITPKQAEAIVRKASAIFNKNMVNGSDIPDNKINSVYDQIDNLIPADFGTIHDAWDFFDH